MSVPPPRSPATNGAPDPGRRRVLRALGLGGLASVAGAIATIRTTGYEVDPARVAKLRFLRPWQLVVVDAAAARICLADVPYDAPGAPPTPREVQVGEFIDAFLAAASEPIQKDASSLFGFLEHGWPLACGHLHRFTALDAAAQDHVLGSLESSRLGMLRGCFHGLKSMVMMGYYRDPRTWGVLGYDGPLVNRPLDGWTEKRHLPVVKSPEKQGGS